MPSVEGSWRWVLVGAVAPVAWGSTYFVTHQYLPSGSPWWGAVLRALPAGLLLLALTRALPRGAWWWRAGVLGVLNVGGFFALVYAAAQLLPTSLASTLMAGSSVLMMLLAWPVLAERPRPATVLGAAVGAVGVVVMLLPGDVVISRRGVAASLAAMSLSSLGYVLARRWGRDVPALPLTAWQLVAGGLLVLPVAVLLEGAPPAVDLPAAVAFGYLTLVATAVAFTAWFAALRRLPAATVGLVGLLNPVTGVLLGTLLGAEAFGLRQAAGVVLVLAGVVLGQRRRRRAGDGQGARAIAVLVDEQAEQEVLAADGATTPGRR